MDRHLRWLPVRPTLLAALLAAAPALSAAPASTPFTDLPKDHWAYPAVRTLVERGILSGYPDGSFQGNNLVTRYALAVSLAKLIEGGPPGQGPAGTRMKLSSDDIESLEKLIREFGDELALVGVKTAAFEEQLKAQGQRIEDLDGRVARLEEEDEGGHGPIKFKDARVRGLAYNRTALEGSLDAIVNVGLDVNEDIEGHLGLRYTNVFDQISNEAFGTYEAYLASKKQVGPIDRVRLGKMNNFLGNGMVLYDVREGLEVTSSRNDVDFELSYFDAVMAHISTDILDEGRLGFYYIKQDRAGNRRPEHLGVYARGKAGKTIGYGMEFTEYDNDGATATNRDQATKSFQLGLDWKPERGPVAVRAGFISQGEDFRALAVDSDLRWQFKGGRVSPHHDLLQALRDATPAGVDPDEVPGFQNLQLGVDVDIPRSAWDFHFGVDFLDGHTRTLNHGDDEFTVWTLAMEREFADSLEFELRFQAISFENENSAAVVDAIPALRRSDTSNVRAQVVKRF